MVYADPERKRAYDRDWRQRNAEHVKAYDKATQRWRDLKRNHQMDRVDWEVRFIAQRGICAGPGCANVPTRVDHDHACCPTHRNSCGKCVRGLLCHGCNRRDALKSDGR